MKNFKVRPVGDHLLVRYLDRREPAIGGIECPRPATAQPHQASVIALGTRMSAKEDDSAAVKVGDTVLVNRNDRDGVKLNRKYTLVREADIVGVVP
jgi:co-chaperonin GroES (HSP10)